MRRALLFILLLLFLGLIGWTVWPTLYRYEHVQGNYLVRINRFTGEADFLRGGWVRSKPSKVETTQARENVQPPSLRDWSARPTDIAVPSKPWELNWAAPSAATVADRLPDEPDAEKKP